jgi:hypothetical protein
MPVIQVYRHGMTAGVPPSMPPSPTHRRGDVQGWSKNATRSNTRFLYSVDETKLTGHGCAVTLTIRDCPPSAQDWKRLREALFVRLRRMGLVRAHWLTEWQRRGVPHLHGALWFDQPMHYTHFKRLPQEAAMTHAGPQAQTPPPPSAISRRPSQ